MTLPGRQHELQAVSGLLAMESPLIVISGPSGIGKTRLAQEVLSILQMQYGAKSSEFLALYRTDWARFIGELRVRIPGIPVLATEAEIQDLVVDWAREDRRILVIDNLETQHVPLFLSFAARWTLSKHGSTIIVTCQPDVRAGLPSDWPTINLEGIRDAQSIRDLMPNLYRRFAVGELKSIAEEVRGNPQSLRFLDWTNPPTLDELFNSARSLREDVGSTVEDLLEGEAGASLFYLALGIHRDGSVDMALLANLWDHFTSQGAEPFIRQVDRLRSVGFLLSAGRDTYRIHERIHAALPKALNARVLATRIPSLHHYFTEIYRRRLLDDPDPRAFGHLVYHALEAGNERLLFDALIGDGLMRRVASTGSAYQVVAECEPLADRLSKSCDAMEMSRFYIGLGQIHNDLSEHREALRLADMAEASHSYGPTSDPALLRQTWYTKAVAFSNTGQSALCRKNYALLVANSFGDDDELACLSLGYLAHDLKYTSLEDADRLGQLAVSWSRAKDWRGTLAKNCCSQAETKSLMGDLRGAELLFDEAWRLAVEMSDVRLQGRVLVNQGFAHEWTGRDGLGLIREGTGLCAGMADRRRQAQGVLYEGAALLARGDYSGVPSLLTSAVALARIGDGRYFCSAYCWIRSVTESRGVGDTKTDKEVEVELASLAQYRSIHPEFDIYERYWRRHYSDWWVRAGLTEYDVTAEGS